MESEYEMAMDHLKDQADQAEDDAEFEPFERDVVMSYFESIIAACQGEVK